jgi:hypothetical protein
MTITAKAGPQIIFADPVNNANPELGPSLGIMGSGVLDPRPYYTYAPGQNFGAATAGWLLNSKLTTVNAIPMTLSKTLFTGAGAHIVANTAMTLITTSVDGCAVGTSIVRADTGTLATGLLKIDPLVASVVATIAKGSTTMTVTAVNVAGGHCYSQLCAGMVLKDTTNATYLPTGTYITGWAPNGGGTGFGGLGTYTLSQAATTAITGDTITGLFTNILANGVPYSTIPYGQAGTVQLWNPGDMISRAVQITSTTSQVSGINFSVKGFDVYGYPITETITTSGTTAISTVGKKAFKYIQSITPDTTDATGNYSVGTQDIVGFPLRTDNFIPVVGTEFDVSIYFNSAGIASSTGYVAAVLTTPTATTGDVRGTYTLQTASNGTLQLFVTQTPQAAAYGSAIGLFGQPHYANF